MSHEHATCMQHRTYHTQSQHSRRGKCWCCALAWPNIMNAYTKAKSNLTFKCEVLGIALISWLKISYTTKPIHCVLQCLNDGIIGKTIANENITSNSHFSGNIQTEMEISLRGEKDKKRHVFDRSCPIGQFFTDLCLFLYLRYQKLSMIISRSRKKVGIGNFKIMNRASCYRAITFISVLMIGTGIWWTWRIDYDMPIHDDVHHRIGVPITRTEVPIFIPAFSERSTLHLNHHPARHFRSFQSVVEVNVTKMKQKEDWGGLDLNFPREGPRKIRSVEDAPVILQRYHDFHYIFQCRDVEFKSKTYPNCNFFHEADMKRRDGGVYTSFVNSGLYRDVWHLRMGESINTIETDTSTSTNMTSNELAIKTLRMHQNVSSIAIADVARDAQIMERF